MQPILRGPVLGEEDHSLVGPLAARPDVVVKPADQSPDLGVKLRGRPFRPGLHLPQQGQLLGRRLAEQQASGVDRLVGRLIGLVINRVVFVHPIDLALEDASGGLGDALPLPGVAERVLMLLQRAEERGGAGEEPFLEGHQHEVGGELLGVVPGVRLSQVGVPLQRGVDAPLLGRVIDFEGLQLPLGEPVLAEVVLGQFRLEAADHHGVPLAGELPRVGGHATGEPLVVQQLQQGSEALGVAVVRRGRQEELVLEVRGQVRIAPVRSESVAYLPRPAGAQLWASSTISTS